MSEKIYVWLLRLYPSHFRETYGDDALALFRDRARDERGLYARLRLWLDVLADLAVSVPREHRREQPALVIAPSSTPAFHFLDGEVPGAPPLLLGAVLSLLPVFALSIPVGHYRPLHFSFVGARRPMYVRPALYRPASTSASRLRSGGGGRKDFHMTPVFFLNVPQDSPSPVKLDASERQRVIQTAIADLKQHYVSPDVGQKMADALLVHEKNGDYNAVSDGAAFADLLTKHLQDVGHDLHLDVAYVPNGIPDRPIGPTPESTARYRKALEDENCSFEKVTILAHNIGYLKLNSFPDVAYCSQTATEAMAKLNPVDTIVIDLRDNRGGFGNMVALIAAYLFDHPEYLYDPRATPTEESWTRSPVPGSRLADKPAYVLISHTTASAAEHFSYNLKMLKRAILVGETTRGATHSGVFYRIDEHFGIGIPEVKAINPYSKTDWAVVGIEPDVKVPAADALDRAQQLAAGKK